MKFVTILLSGGFIGLIAWGVLEAQATTQIERTLRSQRMYLVDLRNDGYRLAFPQEGNVRMDVAPNGRSLFAVKRVFDERGLEPPRDTLIRRSLEGVGGDEEIVSSPLLNVFRCAVSTNERFMIVAGRVKDPSVGEQRDGIFLLNRRDGSIQSVAPFPDAGRNESIGSFNVNDRGNIVVYEDAGTVTKFTGETRLALTERHPGKFPVLMPDGEAYLYADQGWLTLSDRNGKHEVLRIPEVMGAIRVSPDGNFIAFGMESGGDTQLRICELKTQNCMDGPKYYDWIAGRETFWIKR
jgi:hypothetical protein